MKITDVETFVVGTDWRKLTRVRWRTDEGREKRASTQTAGTGR